MQTKVRKLGDEAFRIVEHTESDCAFCEAARRVTGSGVLFLEGEGDSETVRRMEVEMAADRRCVVLCYEVTRAEAFAELALAIALMTDEERLEQFIAQGHDARLLSDRRIVVRLGNGRWFRVAGGDFRSPSLIECSEQPPEPGLS